MSPSTLSHSLTPPLWFPSHRKRDQGHLSINAFKTRSTPCLSLPQSMPWGTSCCPRSWAWRSSSCNKCRPAWRAASGKCLLKLFKTMTWWAVMLATPQRCSKTYSQEFWVTLLSSIWKSRCFKRLSKVTWNRCRVFCMAPLLGRYRRREKHHWMT